MKFMPPKKRTIIIPIDGWIEQAYYLVEASFNVANPVHRYIFFTGFLNGRKDTPGGYNEFFRTEGMTYGNAHYLKPLYLWAIEDDSYFQGPKPITAMKCLKLHHEP